MEEGFQARQDRRLDYLPGSHRPDYRHRRQHRRRDCLRHAAPPRLGIGLEAVRAQALGDGEAAEQVRARTELGRNAQRVVRENEGALQRTVDMIVRQLEGEELYIAPEI